MSPGKSAAASSVARAAADHGESDQPPAPGHDGRRPEPARSASGPVEQQLERRAQRIRAAQRVAHRRRARAPPARPAAAECRRPAGTRTARRIRSARRAARACGSRRGSCGSGASSAMPRACSSAKPASAWARSGCTWIESAWSAARILSRNGSRPPNRPRPPTVRAGRPGRPRSARPAVRAAQRTGCRDARRTTARRPAHRSGADPSRRGIAVGRAPGVVRGRSVRCETEPSAIGHGPGPARGR